MNDVLHALGFIVIFGALFGTIIAAEAWYLHKKGKQDAYCLKETLSNMTTGGLYKVFDGIAIALFIQYFYDAVKQFGFQFNGELTAINLLFLFISVDFFFYFYHMTMHKVRWFWSIHVTHHSSKRMNFSTALRQNFLLDLNFGWVLWWIPLAVIGFDKNWVMIAIELSLAYQFFIHTEVIKRLGFVELLFNTPSHHRVHHSCKQDQTDRNFGGVLIIWDRLFGTFLDEQEAGDIKYGLSVRQPTTLNPLKLNLDEFVQMIKDTVEHRDVSILYKGPNYVETKYGRATDFSETFNKRIS